MGLADAQFSPAIQGAFDNFFNNRTASDGVGIRDHYVNMWDHTAAYFADTPGIIGYGPINEPSAGAETIPCALDFCSESTLQKLRNLNKQVRDVIRRHDSEVGIWLTGYVTTIMGAPARMGTMTMGTERMRAFCVTPMPPWPMSSAAWPRIFAWSPRRTMVQLLFGRTSLGSMAPVVTTTCIPRAVERVERGLRERRVVLKLRGQRDEHDGDPSCPLWDRRCPRLAAETTARV
ncbi:hypothetical protein HMPREF2559_02965 [Corynebacterium sp. HMSC072G08]|uniref:hypothetical protein n=1 Tax=Corynebacterium sp. HMSC072G08 TaxID=1715039 RepID=UPI0008A37955|nr:hypothetical protein [Corynebacterium sp. HMSC072G08]OFN41368.1 hypothetical protein HMPREF2559_02965 [Corynebacterium sp. HMSC072G08]